MTKPKPEKAKKDGLEARRAKRLQVKAQADDLAKEQSVAKAQAAQLAQIINLHIAGLSFAEIGVAVGATADEIEKRIDLDAGRYVRTQPALRAYVRNWISAKYTRLLETVWDEATDPAGKQMLEAQDRAIKILDRMAKLQGAHAPVQTEVKIESAPEAVDAMVRLLAAQRGAGYDVSVFDVIDAEVVHDSADEAQRALEAPDDGPQGKL